MTTSNLSAPSSSLCQKVTFRHLEHLAIIYVRQSTPQQVVHHRESADLQYQLRERAVELGWPESRVVIIDDDQGCSGQSIDHRLGFQRLLAEISLGHVGIVFGREMSRLARSNKDWHQLLELCGLFHVLLADADGVYDPSNFNDRLLLGLKGTMSEAELHVLKNRMHEGRLNKARRGELFGCVPMGYARSADGNVTLDPDEQVRAVVHLIFQKFTELGSAPKVLAYLLEHRVQIGLRAYRGADRGQLRWQKPRKRNIYSLLRHPIYAGAYVYGRNRIHRTRGQDGKVVPGRRAAAEADWICLRDRLPAYISWEQYQANRERLKNNDLGGGMNRAKTTTPTLLNGRIRCGKCGRPLSARNARVGVWPRYVCDVAKHEFGEEQCQGMQADAVDRLIESLVFQAVEPASLELSLRASAQMDRDREQLHKQWRLRLERAGYEADRSRRQYDAVDPENRLVARALERQWDQKLTELRELEEDYARFQSTQPRQLRADERAQIVNLAQDVPALWQAATTTAADRRAVIRLLIEEVKVNRQGKNEKIDMVVRWRGGQVTQHVAYQRTHRYDQLDNYAGLRSRVKQLRGEGKTGREIAEVLNQENYRTARGGRFTLNHVQNLCVLFGLAKIPAGIVAPADLPGAGEWWLTDLARELSVQPVVVHQWRWAGWIHGRQLPGVRGRVIVWADSSELNRLRRLRVHEETHRFQRGTAIPADLITPKKRPAMKVKVEKEAQKADLNT